MTGTRLLTGLSLLTVLALPAQAGVLRFTNHWFVPRAGHLAERYVVKGAKKVGAAILPVLKDVGKVIY